MPRRNMTMTRGRLDALEVIVSFYNCPERLFVRDIASELGCTHCAASRRISDLRAMGYVERYTIRVAPGALSRRVSPSIRRMLEFIAERNAKGEIVTHIEVARHMSTSTGSASVRVTELRAAGLVEPWYCIWPTAAGLAYCRRGAA